jgi:hypothetical protein
MPWRNPRLRPWVAGALIALVGACGDSPQAPGDAPVAPPDTESPSAPATPATPDLSARVGQVVRFSADGIAAGDSLQWSVLTPADAPEANAAIDAAGRFTARTPGRFLVMAAAAARGATALVEVAAGEAPDTLAHALRLAAAGSPGTARLVSYGFWLESTPATVTLAPGARQQFTGYGVTSDGRRWTIRTEWRATGGTITREGLYTAPSASGSYRVILGRQGDWITDTSVVTVGTTTAPAPSPAPSTGTVVFAQDFEAGRGSWDDDGLGSMATVVTPAFGAAQGTRALQVTLPSGSEGGWITKFIRPGLDVPVRMSFAYRTTSTAGNLRIVKVNGAREDNLWSAAGQATVCPTGSNLWDATFLFMSGQLDFYSKYVGMPSNPPGQCWARTGSTDGARFTGSRTLATNTWHRVVVEVVPNAIGQKNGAQRMWVNGTLVAEWTGLEWRTDPILKINQVTLVPFISGGGNGYTVWYDDIRVEALTGGTTTSPTPTSPTPTAPTLSRVELSPSTASVTAGGTFQFSAIGRLSDNSTTPVGVTYSATGGTISSGGLYTAGSTAGTYRVIAVRTGDTLADTSVVTVTGGTTAPAPTAPAPAPTGTADIANFSFDDAAQFGRLTVPGGLSFPSQTQWHKLDPTGGRNGSAAMRVDLSAGDRYEPIGPQWSARSRVFVRYWFRTAGSGFAQQNVASYNVKGPRFHYNGGNLGVLKAEQPNWGFDTEAGAVQVNTGMYWAGQPAAEAGYGITPTCQNLADGNWHSLEIEYDRNAGSNVEVRFWCDGRAVVLPTKASSWGGSAWPDIQYVGGSTATNTPTTLRAVRQGPSAITDVTIFETISQGFSGTIWIDDFAVSSQRIGP